MARIVAYAQAGCDPSLMGIGPVPAVEAVVRILCGCLGDNFLLSNCHYCEQLTVVIAAQESRVDER